MGQSHSIQSPRSLVTEMPPKITMFESSSIQTKDTLVDKSPAIVGSKSSASKKIDDAFAEIAFVVEPEPNSTDKLFSADIQPVRYKRDIAKISSWILTTVIQLEYDGDIEVSRVQIGHGETAGPQKIKISSIRDAQVPGTRFDTVYYLLPKMAYYKLAEWIVERHPEMSIPETVISTLRANITSRKAQSVRRSKFFNDYKDVHGHIEFCQVLEVVERIFDKQVVDASQNTVSERSLQKMRDEEANVERIFTAANDKFYNRLIERSNHTPTKFDTISRSMSSLRLKRKEIEFYAATLEDDWDTAFEDAEDMMVQLYTVRQQMKKLWSETQLGNLGLNSALCATNRVNRCLRMIESDLDEEMRTNGWWT